VFSGAYAEAPRWATLAIVDGGAATAVETDAARVARMVVMMRPSRRNMGLLERGEKVLCLELDSRS
jgi:hypothetical protein